MNLKRWVLQWVYWHSVKCAGLHQRVLALAGADGLRAFAPGWVRRALAADVEPLFGGPGEPEKAA